MRHKRGKFPGGIAIASGVLIALGAANALAADGTLQVEQGLQWFEGGGGTAFNGGVGGGEFGVYDFHLTNPAFSLLPISATAKVTTVVNGNGPFEFQTFCLEPFVNIDFNTVLNFTVSEFVQLAGGATEELDPRTAYLFTKFWTAQAFSPAYVYSPLGAARADSAADLQLALWFTEGRSAYGGGPTDNVDEYIADANAATGAGGSWTALWGSTFPGNLGGVRALNVDRNGVLQQDLLAIFQEEPTEPPPTDECEDWYTGGGFLFETPTGARGTFAAGGGIKKGEFWGHLNYIDHDTGMHVKGTEVTAYSTVSQFTRHTEGTCTIDGVAGTYSLDITDNGEPGKNDVFDLSLSNGYAASGVIDGGNLQLHKPKCKGNKKNKRK